MGRGAGWISHSVGLRPLLPCPYMVMAELEDARPRPKFTSSSPVLKRHQQTRVQNVFLWFPCVVPVNNKMHNVNEPHLFFRSVCSKRRTGFRRFHAHSCTVTVQPVRRIGVKTRDWVDSSPSFLSTNAPRHATAEQQQQKRICHILTACSAAPWQ